MDLCLGNDLDERVQRLRIGIWQMENLAQKYQPLLANDLPVNDRDQSLDGRMDCIDTASNTATYINVLIDFGLLPGWSSAKPKVRDLLSFAVHWTAVAVDNVDTESFAVDSWFRGNGNLPFVMPAEAWREGRTGWQPPFDALNPYPTYTNQLCRQSAS